MISSILKVRCSIVPLNTSPKISSFFGLKIASPDEIHTFDAKIVKLKIFLKINIKKKITSYGIF